VGANNNFYSAAHNRGKVKQVCDFTGRNFDPAELYELTDNLKIKKHRWIGTHCWPGLIETQPRYDKVINITTTTKLSRIYRFARVFYTMTAGLFPGVPKPKKPDDIFNWNQGFDVVIKDNLINIEFENWVNLTCEVKDSLLSLSLAPNDKHLLQRRKVWTEINDFLYDKRFDYIIKEWEKVHN
jgi:hypothetical protein